MLHVTNGDSAVQGIRSAGFADPILPWRDILHDGPVPAALPLAELSRVRARYIADAGGLDFDEVLSDFNDRDATLLSHEDVTLWFEHDLYDQLQLIQILDLLRRQPARVVLVCRDRYLGCIGPEEIRDLWTTRTPVTEAQYALASEAWEAFRAPDPERLRTFVGGDLSALPFLKDALRRHLDDLPSPTDGLARSERQILQAVRDGARTFAEIFPAIQKMEQAVFMGDWSAQIHLERMTNARVPLLTGEPIMLTDAGTRVLAGEANHVKLNGIDRWWGGVHLNAENAARP
jgi:hypothetical protein